MAYRGGCAKIIAEPLRLTQDIANIGLFCRFTNQPSKMAKSSPYVCSQVPAPSWATISIARFICVSSPLYVNLSYSF
jgi:hypothetical protein